MDWIARIRRHFATNLRAKVLLASGTVMVALAVVLTLQSSLRVKDLSYDLLRTRSKAIGEQAGNTVAQSLLLGNASGAQSAIDELTKGEDVAWVIVTNEKKAVVAHTFKDGVPKAVSDHLFDDDQMSGGSEEKVNGKKVLEMDVMLMGGSLGQMHLFLDTAVVAGAIARETNKAIAVTVVGLVLGLLALGLLLNRMIAPIAGLTQATRRIVEDGDLTVSIDVSTEDEVGRLAAYFSQMVERLRQVPLQLGTAAAQLQAAVEALEKSTADQNQTVTRQATALQETQVTAEEIKQTSQTASRTAEGILRAAEKADEIGRQGEGSVEQSLQALEAMRAQVGEIAKRINELGDRTRQIGDITGTVKELADQSNMLALNAAIEAVRAGEHGKGFSLVAREIRRLADQSIQATNRVREILDSVSGAAAAAVKNTEAGQARIEVGLSQAKASGDNLKALAGLVRENNSAARQIAAAVSQQNTGISQVFTAVMDQSKMMDDTVKRLEETLKSVDSLKQVSASILGVVRSYKV